MKLKSQRIWATTMVLGLATPLVADEPAAASAAEVQTEVEKKEKPVDSERAKLEKEKEFLALENALSSERSKKELADLQAEVARLKLQKELLTETIALTDLELKKASRAKNEEMRQQVEKLDRELNISKIESEKAVNELKKKEAEWGLEVARLESEMKTIEVGKKREAYADAKPVYLENPLLEDGTLVISDRRIELNGPIAYDTAEHVTERINYFNNKDPKFPIFIVIDDSPGGSVMAGMRILKSMEGSQAPVYVVVKSFAASMAATITTLAERSFAYPNAVLLHHQILSGNFGNLTETREFTREMEEWWRRLATPVAAKMGISREDFIKTMYEKRSSGDWAEFADDAAKLKWVDQVVSTIRETSLLKNPDAQKPADEPAEELMHDEEKVLFRLNPKDLLYMYDPTGQYPVGR